MLKILRLFNTAGGFLWLSMRKKVIYLIALSLLACAPQKVAEPPGLKTPPVTRVPVVRPVRKEYKISLRCDEDTHKYFNRTGMDVLPFLRPAFFDFDNDGTQEMIAGSKDGSLRLYKNLGNRDVFRWRIVENYFSGIKVGAFASPAVGDIDGDGRAEVLVGSGGFSSNSGVISFYKNDGNSDGDLFLFRNKTEGGKIAFVEDSAFFRNIDLGMYVVPAVAATGNKLYVVVGNSKGNVYILESALGSNSFKFKKSMDISLSSFASPTFVKSVGSMGKNLVISDGKGELYYFRNRNDNYLQWEEVPQFFGGRISPGPATAPSVVDIEGQVYMVVGNINGKIKLYRYDSSSNDLPWREVKHHFGKIGLSSFSKGMIAEFQKKELLITGQQDGTLRAFINFGTMKYPLWTEQGEFFRMVPKIPHSAPSVFDIDADGKWELIIGDSKGYVHGFRYKITGDGKMSWTRIDNTFENVKVGRYAAPTLFRNADNIILLVGQQDGKISIYVATVKRGDFPVFQRAGFIEDLQVNNHSSPAAFVIGGQLEISVGDYSGNLKNFACSQEILK
jgi:hypothetical protein